MRTRGDRKSKRGRPETASPENTTTTKYPSDVQNEDVIRRGLPRKGAKTEKPSNTTQPNANGIVSVSILNPVESVMARVVPAMDAAVKVFCVHTDPKFSFPWHRKRQYSSSSSGFVIGGRRVLTNAHSVEHFTQVKLKKRGSDTKYVATVLAIGNECDIGQDNSFLVVDKCLLE